MGYDLKYRGVVLKVNRYAASLVSSRSIVTMLNSIGIALLAIGILGISGAVATAKSFEENCLNFKPDKHISDSTLTKLEYVTAGTTIDLDDNVQSCNRPSQLVKANICRVGLQILTSKQSSISFELWLPEEWEHDRFLATGNGGVDGCIKYEELAYGTSNGLATMGTNNGHNGTTGQDFLNNPDIIKDFSYRALHVGTQSAKSLITTFYRRSPSKSYYLGCSLGGRMGIKAAEKYPEDYDGIVAGAPAVDFNHLNGQRARFWPITGSAGDESYIAIDKWTGLIHDEVMRQCDGIDGVEDGIIEVANRCAFDPTTLLCQENKHDVTDNGRKCLTSAQIAQVKEIYSPFRYPDGSMVFPRMNPGNEKGAVDKLLAGKPFAYSVDYFRYIVYSDPSWDPSTFSTADVKVADDLDPFGLRTYPTGLGAFKSRGGKLISYHGGQDNQITSFNTERFWDRMQAADGDLGSYARFFRISGMNHCSGGPGAWTFGQGGNKAAEGLPFDAPQNILASLLRWVEDGEAPDVIRGTKFVDDEFVKGVDFHRDHCLYPRVQAYLGGDHKLLSSWKCT